VPALAPSLEFAPALPPGPIDFSGSFGSLRPLSIFLPVGKFRLLFLPFRRQGSHRNNQFTQPSVEVAPAAFADSVVGDFGVPGFFDAYYVNPSLF
jgi:hypothetical protein